MKLRLGWLLAASLALPAQATTLIANDFESPPNVVGPAPTEVTSQSDGTRVVAPGGSLSGQWLEFAAPEGTEPYSNAFEELVYPLPLDGTALHLTARLSLSDPLAGDPDWVTGGRLEIAFGDHATLSIGFSGSDFGEPASYASTHVGSIGCPLFDLGCLHGQSSEVTPPPLGLPFDLDIVAGAGTWAIRFDGALVHEGVYFGPGVPELRLSSNDYGSDSDWIVLLDDLRLETVPEPAGLAWWALALLASAAVRRCVAARSP